MAVVSENLGIDVIRQIAAGTVGKRVDPFLACNFFVDIEGIIVGSFSEVSGLEAEIETYPYREGGRNEHMHCFAGATKYPPLVLKHGLSPFDGLWSWQQDVVNGAIQRRNGTLYLLDRLRIPVVWWDFKEALPIKWTGPTFNAAAATVAFESITLAHNGLSRPRVVNAALGAASETIANFGGRVRL